jgi:hypothetical protein
VVKVLTQNVFDLRASRDAEGRLATLVPVWMDHGADIVVATGTRVGFFQQAATEMALIASIPSIQKVIYTRGIVSYY